MPRPHRPTLEGARQKQESRKERKARLIAEATERQAAWAALSVSDKLRALKSRPGESRSQRARLEPAVAKAAEAAAEAAKLAAVEAAKVTTKVVLPSEAASGSMNTSPKAKKAKK